MKILRKSGEETHRLQSETGMGADKSYTRRARVLYLWDTGPILVSHESYTP